MNNYYLFIIYYNCYLNAQRLNKLKTSKRYILQARTKLKNISYNWSLIEKKTIEKNKC